MRTPSLILVAALAASASVRDFDVVVYGGTAGGVTAAVAAAREGMKTALVEPGAHLGGMVSGGLGWTDYGKKEVIGGCALEFYYRVGRHYQVQLYGQDVAWLPEPHVAEEIFRTMVREAGVALFERERLVENNGVRKQGPRVMAISTEAGDQFTARVFIDSTYEGDLMAQAGVKYAFGREAVSQYGESLAGVREQTPYHQFLVNISAYDGMGKLLPEVSARTLPAAGSADKAVQAYNFRMCFTDVAANRMAFVKPAGYDAARYELLARLIRARTEAEGRVPALDTLMTLSRIPNGKTDINNNGPFSTDYIGGSWNYPDASYAEREKIWRAHKDYQAGFFYFLANDAQVPESLRQQMNRWGLAKDEFSDTENWPRQLYIREARRMVGDYVMTQKDLQTDRTKPDTIGLGSYNSDSHNVERIAGPDGNVRNEGDMEVAVQPYQVPYRVMLPKKVEVENLLVPVAFSASHVAYSSIRMEPQYMILGHAAGAAARLAVESGKAVQDIDVSALMTTLRKEGAILEYQPNPQGPALQLLPRLVRR